MKSARGLNDIAKMQYIDMNFWLQGDILLKADKMSMAHSLEARVPYLDIKVFEYIKNLPIDYRVTDEATKRAFRIAAKRHLPESTANKKETGIPGSNPCVVERTEVSATGLRMHFLRM